MDSESTPPDVVKERLLDAAIEHVRFDGWSYSTFRAAALDAGIEIEEAWRICKRGSFDLAIAHHKRGDVIMRDALAAKDFSEMRVRDRIAFAVRTRINADSDRDVVRRSSALFALPLNSAEGGRLMWGTADAIWTALGDTSDDVNWYTKRMILTGVHSATVLYWLGDESLGSQNTWAFLDRRISDVMEFEKLKGQLRKNPVTKRLFAIADNFVSGIRPPSGSRRDDLPGRLPSGS